MPRKPKPANRLTTDEALRKLFPKKVINEAKREAEKARVRDAKSKPK